MAWTVEVKSGLRGRFGFWRAAIRSETGRADVRTAELAETIARLLNDADNGKVPPRPEAESPFRRYEVVPDPYGLEARRVSRFNSGLPHPVALASDDALARRIADLLNRVDTAVRD